MWFNNCVWDTVSAEFWGNMVRDTDFRYMLSALSVSEAVGDDLTIGADVPTHFRPSAYARRIVYACATVSISGRNSSRLVCSLFIALRRPGKAGCLGISKCSIPDDHIDPRRSALFMARSILSEVRDGGATC